MIQIQIKKNYPKIKKIYPATNNNKETVTCLLAQRGGGELIFIHDTIVQTCLYIEPFVIIIIFTA